MLRPNETINTREAYLYVIEIGDTGIYKIGVTGDIDKRIYTLQTSNPVKLHERFLSNSSPDGVRALELEAKVHRLLNGSRLSGEWFKCDLSEIFNAIDTAFVGLYYERRKPRNPLKCHDLYYQSATPFTKRMATDLRSILRAANRYRDLALFSVQVSTFLRPPQILNLRVRDVYDDSRADTDRFICSVHSLDDYAKNALNLYLLGREDYSPDDWLFLGKGGNRLSPKELQKIIEDWVFLLRQVGMDDLDPANYNAHSVRKGKAFYIYQETGDLDSCRILLGQEKRWHTACYLGVEALTGRHLNLLTAPSPTST